jgi:hypothetical protein
MYTKKKPLEPLTNESARRSASSLSSGLRLGKRELLEKNLPEAV